MTYEEMFPCRAQIIRTRAERDAAPFHNIWANLFIKGFALSLLFFTKSQKVRMNIYGGFFIFFLLKLKVGSN